MQGLNQGKLPIFSKNAMERETRVLLDKRSTVRCEHTKLDPTNREQTRTAYFETKLTILANGATEENILDLVHAIGAMTLVNVGRSKIYGKWIIQSETISFYVKNKKDSL